MMRPAVALMALCILGACDKGSPAEMTPVEPTGIAASYPDLEAVFGAEQGVFAGCGPNDGVCHNASRYPDLSSVGAIAESVGRGCNHLRETRGEIHDWCEVRGDYIRIDDETLELVGITELPGARAWTVEVDGQLPDDFDYVAIERLLAGTDDEYVGMYEDLGERLDVRAEGSNSLRLELLEGDGDDADWEAQILSDAFAQAGRPGNPSSIQLADSNGNGVRGATLGKGLLVPGHPEDSYLIRRLIDPSFGTLMPLANCCFWSKESLRALWCWVAGLDEDGGNAHDPIDYASCPAGPDETVVYPEPGPECEQSGLCPVMTEEMLGG